MKHIFAFLFLLLSAVASFGQNISDYFFKRGSNFVYNNPVDYSYDEYIYDGDFLEDKTYHMYQLVSRKGYKISFTKNAVASKNQVFVNGFFPQGKVTEDYMILVALPNKNGPYKWSETVNDTKYSCSASWKDVLIFGQHATAIEVTKKAVMFSKPVVEKSYWVKDYGLVKETTKIGDAETKVQREMRRTNLYVFSSREEYDNWKEEQEKEQAYEQFVKENEHVKYVLNTWNPDLYDKLKKEFIGSIQARNNKGHILYEGSYKVSKGFKTLNEFHGVSIAHKAEGKLSKGEKPTFYYGYDCNECESISTPIHVNWAPKSFVGLIETFPSAVEPRSGKEYRFNVDCSLAVEEKIDVLNFKVKLKKGEYQLVSGPEDDWDFCKGELKPHLDKLFVGKKSGVMEIGIVKSTIEDTTVYYRMCSAPQFEYTKNRTYVEFMPLFILD